MKSWLPILWVTCLTFITSLSPSFAGSTVLYVSEAGDKRIAVYSLDQATGELTRKGDTTLPGSPGSLAISADRRHLYAAVRSERQLATLPVDPTTGQLGEPVITPPGINPVYVHIDKTGSWVLTASYGEGAAAISRIQDGIIVGAPVVTLETGKKAHSIQTDPSNRFAFVPHAGELNKVEQLRFDPVTGKFESNTPPYLPGGPGHGPRHMQFHPNGRWVYLVNEQGKSVTHCDFDPDKGTLTQRQTVPTVPPDWDQTQGSCADIHVSADGRFVYASTRGHDSLATYSVHQETGELSSLGQTPTEKTPRSFCLVPGPAGSGESYVVSAGEGSDALIVFKRDIATGKLTPLKTYPCGKGPAWVMAVVFE
ncbi:lactonase family protein [Phragmitibacter flavus]|nr:lactonase family protein [Phragmitibacter flavus]